VTYAAKKTHRKDSFPSVSSPNRFRRLRVAVGGAVDIDLVTLAYLALAIVFVLFAFDVVSEVAIPNVINLKLRQVENRVNRLESEGEITAEHTEEARLQADEAKDLALSVGAIPLGKKSSRQTVAPLQAPAASGSSLNPQDPQKGRWGGNPASETTNCPRSSHQIHLADTFGSD
jgi:hypothetical protein